MMKSYPKPEVVFIKSSSVLALKWRFLFAALQRKSGSLAA
jgi:hypothetical protein